MDWGGQSNTTITYIVSCCFIAFPWWSMPTSLLSLFDHELEWCCCCTQFTDSKIKRKLLSCPDYDMKVKTNLICYCLTSDWTIPIVMNFDPNLEIIKINLHIGLEAGFSGVQSGHSINNATTTAREVIFLIWGQSQHPVCLFSFFYNSITNVISIFAE